MARARAAVRFGGGTARRSSHAPAKAAQALSRPQLCEAGGGDEGGGDPLEAALEMGKGARGGRQQRLAKSGKFTGGGEIEGERMREDVHTRCSYL